MSRATRFVFITTGLLFAAFAGFVTPAFASNPHQTTAPIENSIFPALVQVMLIVFVTEGIKSLARVLGGTNADGSPKVDLSGKAAAYAYIAVGLAVYVIQMYLLPALPVGAADAVGNILGVLATLLAGSGLFSMTSAFRVSK